MKRLLTLCLLALPPALFAAASARAQTAPVAEDRLVLQVSDDDIGKWNTALNNVKSARKLAKDDTIDYAKAGIVRLMRRQHQGWAHIRP